MNRVENVDDGLSLSRKGNHCDVVNAPVIECAFIVRALTQHCHANS